MKLDLEGKSREELLALKARLDMDIKYLRTKISQGPAAYSRANLLRMKEQLQDRMDESQQVQSEVERSV